ncbi:TonB-dependent receptor [Spongiibacter taiwanensis]|uniref:TonB-dependent receptor n=1 Tax=Spongiibacter taiwanensis TaxID=1748242 RepID=UPI002034C078|nr:TonB-dependent receptor [Spongiibacter taiwanensis]USA43181.1 TonB-dependent receptor [Spongiibacter taiwanensis]
MALKNVVSSFRKSLLATSIAALSSGAVAQAVLEEVIVTATLRAESLQDVPVSVNAVTGEKMLEAGIGKIEDLQSYVPNLTMSETGIGTNIYIRGIGSGINPGFEQSVGMYFDGVSYGRAQLTRAPFLDLQRVEVLRGPQNILFGKNSIAGALSLISARPGQEFEGMVSGTFEPDTNERILDFVASGPINDEFGARLAIRKREIDGHIENITLNRDEPQREEQTIRLILDWDVNADLTASLKLETGSFDVNGRQIEIINDQRSTSGTSAFTGRTYAEILDFTEIPVGPIILARVDADSSVLNNRQDYKRSSNGDFSYNDTRNATLNVDYYRDGHQFTFITGLLGYKTDELCDCDFTGAPVFSVAAEEEYKQFSQELRWVSPVGETFEFIAGGFVQFSELDFYDSIRVDSDILPGLLNAADLQEVGGRGERPPFDLEGGPFDDVTENSLEGSPLLGVFQPLFNAGLPELGGIGDAGDAIRNLGTPRYFSSDTELFSVFLQTTWNVTDVFRTTLGLRYAYEKKDGSRSLDFRNIATGERFAEGEIDTVVAKNFSAERHNLKGSRTESNVSPSLNFQYDYNDDIMLYSTISKGFKSGGYDARSNASPDTNSIRPLQNADDPQILVGSFEYDEEEATSLEVGAKTTLWNGAAELNVAAFYTKYDNLQVSIFDGTLGFNVGNAGAANTMGIELDGRVALSEKLMLTGALALLDFEFTDYENGQCYQGQPADSVQDGVEYCNYKGKTNQYVADYSGNIGLVYTTSVWEDLELRSAADFVFTGDYNSSQNLDPSQEQQGYVKTNLRVSLSDPLKGWEVAALVKNLTDETIISYSNDTPLSSNIFGSIGHYGFVEAPRTFAIQGTYRWY